jgi:hypothetical protein
MWAMIFQVKEFWEPFASEYERWVAFATQDNPPPHVRKQLQGTLFYARAFREQWNNLRDRLGHTGFILLPRSRHSDKAKLTSFAARAGYIVQESSPVQMPLPFTFVSAVWPILSELKGRSVFSRSILEPGTLIEGKASEADSTFLSCAQRIFGCLQAGPLIQISLFSSHSVFQTCLKHVASSWQDWPSEGVPFLTSRGNFVNVFLGPLLHKADTPERFMMAACRQSHDIATGIRLTNLGLYYPGSAPGHANFRNNVSSIQRSILQQIQRQSAITDGSYSVDAAPDPQLGPSARTDGLLLVECSWWREEGLNMYRAPPDLMHFELHGYVSMRSPAESSTHVCFLFVALML